MDIDKDYVLRTMSKSLERQFELYSWENMINDSDLTCREKKWAEKNIGYKAYIIE